MASESQSQPPELPISTPSHPINPIHPVERRFDCKMVIADRETPEKRMCIQGFAELLFDDHPRPHIIFTLKDHRLEVNLSQTYCLIAVRKFDHVDITEARSVDIGTKDSLLVFDTIPIQQLSLHSHGPCPLGPETNELYYDLIRMKWVDQSVTIQASLDVVLGCISSRAQCWIQDNLCQLSHGAMDVSKSNRRDRRSLSPRSHSSPPKRSRWPVARTASRARSVRNLDREMFRQMSSLNIAASQPPSTRTVAGIRKRRPGISARRAFKSRQNELLQQMSSLNIADAEEGTSRSEPAENSPPSSNLD